MRIRHTTRTGGARGGRAPVLAAAVLAAATLAAPVVHLPSAYASAAGLNCNQADHWGAFFGASGGADEITSPQTITIPDPGACITQLATSNSDEYALMTDHTVWGWGLGAGGELGNGLAADSLNQPVQVTFPAGTFITSIPTDAMPFDSAMAIDSAGNLWVWGLNRRGELCTGNTAQVNTPVIANLPAPVTLVAGADQHMIAVANGTVVSCGLENHGDLGTGQPQGTDDLSPAPVAGLPSTPVALVSAELNAGALMSNGTYYDWGYNAAGQVGNRTTTTVTRPVKVSLPGPVSQVAQGGSVESNGQTLVMLQDGSVYAWGNDSYAQLGNGQINTYATSPIPVRPPAGVTWQKLAAGGGTSYAIDLHGKVWAWGAGSAGQIGDRIIVQAQATPVQVDAVTPPGLISSTANNVAVAGTPGRPNA